MELILNLLATMKLLIRTLELILLESTEAIRNSYMYSKDKQTRSLSLCCFIKVVIERYNIIFTKKQRN